MKLMIEIDNSIYDICKSVRNLPLDENDIMSSLIMQSIANGTPLPKGHGRLIDIDAVWDEYPNKPFIECITETPTIIEADKE